MPLQAEHGRHLETVQRMKQASESYAALPELLIRAWTQAALREAGLSQTAAGSSDAADAV